MAKRFVIYGLLGWCLEVFWTGIGSMFRGDIKLSAQTYVWMFLIYGLAVFLEPIHNIIRHWSVIARGGVYTILIFSIEYLTGWLLKILIGVCPWCYEDSLAINTFITLRFIPVWFTVGLLFEKAHDFFIRVRVID